MPPSSRSRRLFDGTFEPRVTLALALLAMSLAERRVSAQENYEIQVYGSDIVAPGTTMIELPSNYTASGRSTIVDGVLPTDHAWHETLEVTHGFTPWFEIGFYTFTSARTGQGWEWVGNHIRPRLRAPESWHWPVGVSLSQEVGYQRRSFSPETWTWEIRPIIDKRVGRWYWSVNPTLEVALTGEEAGRGVGFSPNAVITFDFTKHVTGAIEYYGSWGPITHLDPLQQQQHQIFPGMNLDLSPDWEINFGVGDGLTNGTDHLLVKLILGYRLGP